MGYWNGERLLLQKRGGAEQAVVVVTKGSRGGDNARGNREGSHLTEFFQQMGKVWQRVERGQSTIWDVVGEFKEKPKEEQSVNESTSQGGNQGTAGDVSST